MIVICSILLKKTKIRGITLFPFILLRNKADKGDAVLINHEKIHIRQQMELLIFFFYLWYVIEFYYWFFKLKNGHLAYRSISFEKEAYAKEGDFTYLKKRKPFAFLRYRK